MRILFVVEHFPCLSETFVLNQVTGLLDRGHHVEVYPLGKPVAPVVHPAFNKYNLQDRNWVGPNIPVSRIRRVLRAFKYFPTSVTKFPGATMGALNLFRHRLAAANLYLYYSFLPFLNTRPAFDVIHCHFGDKGVLAQLWHDWGLVRGKISVVFHAHEMAGLSDEEGRKTYSALFKSDALLLPISNHWRELLLRWGAQPERTFVHHMGVDCESIQFQPRTIHPGQRVQFVSVCRMTEMKGIEFAIRAVARLRPRYPNLHYIIAGDGPLRAPLTDLVKELSLTECIAFIGPQPQDQVQKLLQNSHLFLAPSITDSSGCTEGIPVAIMEAMAGGLPVVSTRHAGIPELIIDGVSGVLVKERDVPGLATAAETLIANPGLYANIAQQGRAMVEREFNVCSLNARLEDFFITEGAK